MKLIKKPCGLHCIKIVDIGVKYGEEEVLKNVNLHIHCGTFNVLIGKNGAGKSSLVRALLGDVEHTGRIEFKDIQDGKLQGIRIGYVPQKMNVEKHTPISVYDMMACYHSNAPAFLLKSKKVRVDVIKALEIFEAEDLIDQQICNLSGGELQRVLLSMACMNKPNLLILDEPISGMDVNGTELFYKTMKSLKENFDMAILLISHDLSYVAKYADHVILLDKEIKKQGSVEEVFKSSEFKEVFGNYEV